MIHGSKPCKVLDCRPDSHATQFSMGCVAKQFSNGANRAGRVASEGAVGSYIHAGGKIGVLIEVNCETDFCAKSDAFQSLVKELALQVAALNPRVVRREVTAEEAS